MRIGVLPSGPYGLLIDEAHLQILRRLQAGTNWTVPVITFESKVRSQEQEFLPASLIQAAMLSTDINGRRTGSCVNSSLQPLKLVRTTYSC